MAAAKVEAAATTKPTITCVIRLVAEATTSLNSRPTLSSPTGPALVSLVAAIWQEHFMKLDQVGDEGRRIDV